MGSEVAEADDLRQRPGHLGRGSQLDRRRAGGNEPRSGMRSLGDVGGDPGQRAGDRRRDRRRLRAGRPVPRSGVGSRRFRPIRRAPPRRSASARAAPHVRASRPDRAVPGPGGEAARRPLPPSPRRRRSRAARTGWSRWRSSPAARSPRAPAGCRGVPGSAAINGACRSGLRTAIAISSGSTPVGEQARDLAADQLRLAPVAGALEQAQRPVGRDRARLGLEQVALEMPQRRRPAAVGRAGRAR